MMMMMMVFGVGGEREFGDGFDVLVVHEASEEEDGEDEYEYGEVASALTGGGGWLHGEGGGGGLEERRREFPAEGELHDGMLLLRVGS